jgi:hypothetical protein
VQVIKSATEERVHAKQNLKMTNFIVLLLSRELLCKENE